jgi:hypothetical protein
MLAVKWAPVNDCNRWHLFDLQPIIVGGCMFGSGFITGKCFSVAKSQV